MFEVNLRKYIYNQYFIIFYKLYKFTNRKAKLITDEERDYIPYLIFDVYEQVCGAYTVQALQHNANREKLVESPHCRIVNH